MCKFTLYFRCKCPLVSLVIFWSSSGPPTTAYHCLEMLFCSDHTWGFCMPFSFSPVRLCLFHCRGRFVITTETHVACDYLSPRMTETQAQREREGEKSQLSFFFVVGPIGQFSKSVTRLLGSPLPLCHVGGPRTGCR